MKIKCRGIHYNVEVVGVGEPLVCLHGFTGDNSTWDAILPYLSPTMQVIKVDLIGHGKTDVPESPQRYSMIEVLQDIKIILDHLELATVNILGYSMGGRVALAFALNYPQSVKTLLLESASPGLETWEERRNRQRQDDALAQKILNEGIVSFINFWETLSLFSGLQNLSRIEKGKLREQRLRNNPIGLANSLKAMGTGVQESYWERLSELINNVELIVGEQDKKFVMIANKMKQRLPRCVIHSVSDASHTIHVEQPEKFGTIVNGALITT
ncbi:2-succinyl-6-hydroxy-2,4-cyclohexadiene-1-carboxylate synthase [Bacillus coahuilensis]|uniref:2-succinyl-6-hydroxy-2, 4-cyclohexadiene-1-carboxylate synthase n=1 Tax=Bacillus coahuilensis TaxID=408580 RepID=UPI0007503040|nr:2-succinyl-6-hydroxy-2,4-cyclohexadiene-1-carboxylate synthase [Bacillus coahuilensis]